MYIMPRKAYPKVRGASPFHLAVRTRQSRLLGPSRRKPSEHVYLPTNGGGRVRKSGGRIVCGGTEGQGASGMEGHQVGMRENATVA